jgi:hypothetical protein
MWPKTFAERLASWSNLRRQCEIMTAHDAVTAINSWWFEAPWRPYHLHWDDRKNWPDPWQLLDDNLYCSVARGLGIMYTIAMLDHPDLQDAVLVEVDGDNLVLVVQAKYILNWDRGTVVNINPSYKNNTRRSIAQSEIKLQIK